jgi:phosphoribosylglycinamide formyltransferase-1
MPQKQLWKRRKETGITIHYVNEHYDEGVLFFQKSVVLNGLETPEEVAIKIHRAEFFPTVIDKC